MIQSEQLDAYNQQRGIARHRNTPNKDEMGEEEGREGQGRGAGEEKEDARWHGGRIMEELPYASPMQRGKELHEHSM